MISIYTMLSYSYYNSLKISVCLYLEAFHTPYNPRPNSELEGVIFEEFDVVENDTKLTKTFPTWYVTSEAEYIDLQECSFQQMTVWEFEEMDCVSNYLNHNYTSYCYRPLPHCHHFLLSGDSNSHLPKCRHQLGHEYMPSDHGGNSEHACEWFRVDLELGILSRTTALDTASWSGIFSIMAFC